jgi:hypothetical protein
MTKDEQDALVFLSQTHRSLHEQRIKRSFKIIVSTLTFFVLCVAAKFAADTKLPTSEASFKAVVWITFIALWGVAAINFWGSRGANMINQDIAQKAEDAIITHLADKKLIVLSPPNRNPRKMAWLWEMLIVLGGAVASAYAITCL